MKLRWLLICSGILLLVLGYFLLPSVAQSLLRKPRPEHVEVNTSNIAAVHIATSDPSISLFVQEDKGVISVIFFRQLPKGDFVSLEARANVRDQELHSDFMRRTDDVVVLFKQSDRDDIPTRRVSGPRGGPYINYDRGPIDWVEDKSKGETPNQTSQPTPPSGVAEP